MKALLLALLFPLAGAMGAEGDDSPIKRATAAIQKGDVAGAYRIILAEAEKGDMGAANAAGEMLLAGRGTPVSVEGAVRWFEKAAAANQPAAQLNLARLLGRGMGVAKDEERAHFLVLQAAEAGFASAQVEQARLLEAGVDLKAPRPDFSEARAWLEKAAAQEYPDALHALVRYTDEGLAGPADPLAATRLCQRAAKKGSIAAMNDMGVRYQKGTGVALDNVAAVGWFTLAAQHGLPAAFVNLGNCYDMGNGLKQDYAKAGQNYAVAAGRDFPIAFVLLGQLFEQGHGTDVDLVKAYAMYKRAAASNLALAAQAVERIEGKLTAGMKAAAEKLAANGKVIPAPTHGTETAASW